MTGKRSPPMGAHGFIVEWSKFGHGEPFQQTSSGCATRIHDHRGRSVRFSPAPWMVRWVWTVMSPTSYCIGSDISRSCSSGKAVSRSEEHTSELQSLMRISYAVFCLKKKTNKITYTY